MDETHAWSASEETPETQKLDASDKIVETQQPIAKSLIIKEILKMEKKEKKKEPSKYDAMGISVLESQVIKLFTMSRESQKEMYMILDYLRMTNRFRENTRYKKTSFWVYLEDRFTIREGTFRENVRAFTKFPEFAVEYGAGIINKIDKVCGAGRIGKVISEITKETTARKKPLNRASIETIIQKHKVERIEKIQIDWTAKFEQEAAAHIKTKEALRAALSTIKELDAQILKLKITAEKYNRLKDEFSGTSAFLQWVSTTEKILGNAPNIKIAEPPHLGGQLSPMWKKVD